jgi:hypothetical protein
MNHLLQRLRELLHSAHVIAIHRLAQLLGLLFDPGAFLIRQFISQILQGLLSLVGQTISIVASDRQFSAPAIFGCIALSLLNHTINILLVEVRTGCNGNLLLFTSCTVFGIDV